jgi:hypothetical protein
VGAEVAVVKVVELVVVAAVKVVVALATTTMC